MKSLLGAMLGGIGLSLMFLTSSDAMSAQPWFVQLGFVAAVLLVINVVLYFVFNKIFGKGKLKSVPLRPRRGFNY